MSSVRTIVLIAALVATPSVGIGEEFTEDFAKGFAYGQHVLTEVIETACDSDGKFSVQYGYVQKDYTCKPITF